MVDDKSLSMSARSRAALWLWKRGDDAKRKWLLDRYADYLVDISTKNGWDPGVRETLQDLTVDTDLIGDLEAMAPRQTNVRAKNNISTLIEDMRRNSTPLEQFLPKRESMDWDERVYAIVETGHKGSPEHLPLLQKIPRWDRPSQNDDTLNAERTHQDKLIREAIGNIKRRAYIAKQEAAAPKPSTRPAQPATRPAKPAATTKAN